jgi:uncharacterized coiled-coil protein SlyX
MDSLENRMLRLEFQVTSHDKDLQELQTTSKDLRSALQGIERNLSQIRWMVTGGAVVFTFSEMGLATALKAALGFL